MTASDTTILISFDGLRERLGLACSRATLWRMSRDGRLPLPLKTSPCRGGRLFWNLAEVEAAIARWPTAVAKADVSA